MKDKLKITGPGIPQGPLPFSPAIQSGDFIFVSGQASVGPDGSIVTGDFEEECRRSFDNLRALLQVAGLDFSDVVQIRGYVGKQEDLVRYNEVYKEYFDEPYPARTTLIGCLGDVLKFEVDAVARLRVNR